MANEAIYNRHHTWRTASSWPPIFNSMVEHSVPRMWCTICEALGEPAPGAAGAATTTVKATGSSGTTTGGGGDTRVRRGGGGQ